jgi:hypothetical protein
MVFGGLSATIFELFFAKVIFFRFVIGGACIAFAGCYLLWTDFVAPRFGIKTWED